MQKVNAEIDLKEHKNVKFFNKVTDMNQQAVDRIPAQNLLPLPGGLVAQFSTVDLPQTIEMGDRGKVNVQLINQSPAPVTGPVTVKLYISTDEIIDRAS